jgi:splicing suppressor protein 51
MDPPQKLTKVDGITTPNTATRSCTHCKKREPSGPLPAQKLKRCSRCRTSLYCSRACQRADWKNGGHKKTCMFGALANNCYLDNLSTEEETFDQLIDTYRLRVEDEMMYGGRSHGRYAEEHVEDDRHSQDNGSHSALQDLRRFLDLAEAQIGQHRFPDSPKKSSILPDWWTPEKRETCERRAVGGPSNTTWSMLCSPVTKEDIREHYQDGFMPMKLRMLAESVYGSNVMGRLQQ